MAHGLSCSAACGIFLDQGLNLYPLHWQADSYPLHHQGSPPHFFLTVGWSSLQCDGAGAGWALCKKWFITVGSVDHSRRSSAGSCKVIVCEWSRAHGGEGHLCTAAPPPASVLWGFLRQGCQVEKLLLGTGSIVALSAHKSIIDLFFFLILTLSWCIVDLIHLFSIQLLLWLLQSYKISLVALKKQHFHQWFEKNPPPLTL